MTWEELKKIFEDFKSEGYEEEEILEILYLMYADGKIPLEDLRIMTEVLGYEFTEEFEAMSEEDKKKNGLKKAEKTAEGVDKEDVEDAKEFKEGEDEEARADELFGFGGEDNEKEKEQQLSMTEDKENDIGRA